jgi:hypothetical protein
MERMLTRLLTKKVPYTFNRNALVAAAKLDEYWSHLRMTDPDLIGRNLLKSGYAPYSGNNQLGVSNPCRVRGVKTEVMGCQYNS